MGNRTKKEYMRDEAFAELMEATEQALAYERGKREGYRVVYVESPKSSRKAPAGKAVAPKNNPSSRRKHKNAADG